MSDNERFSSIGIDEMCSKGMHKLAVAFRVAGNDIDCALARHHVILVPLLLRAPLQVRLAAKHVLRRVGVEHKLHDLGPRHLYIHTYTHT